MSGSYSRLSQNEAAEEFDNDSVALMQGQAPPRLSRFGATDYVQLEDLNEEGHDERLAERTHVQFQQNTSKTRRMLMRVLVLVFFVIIGTMLLIGFWQQKHPTQRKSPARSLVLTKPLDASTRFSNGTHTFKRSTLVISLDGMHPHYVSNDRTPHLDKLAQSGFAVPYITPSFPTQTFPNHWTLITGNYPINHGIVGNTFYDPELDLEFVNVDPKKSRDRRFWGGEPVWITAKNHGVRSAVHMWPGSEADWGNQYPDEYSQFDAHEPLNEKSAKILGWLDRAGQVDGAGEGQEAGDGAEKEEMPQLMLAYVPNIDSVGHLKGISGPDLTIECMSVDDFVGSIVDGLQARNLTNIVNLIILSDHGMAPTRDDHLVFLDDIIENWENVTSNRGWPLAGLRFKHGDGDVGEALASAKDAKKEHKGFSAFASDKFPQSWHFTTGDLVDSRGRKTGPGKYRGRLAPMYIVPDPTYSVLTHAEWDEMEHHYYLAGVHGYEPSSPLMRALFLAQGPAFPPGKYESFENIDVYSAICRSLGFVESGTSDGNFTGVPMLKKLSYENYPGRSDIESYFHGSSFADYYERSD